MSDTTESSARDGEPSWLERLSDALYAPFITFFDDVGATVMLGARTVLWLARPRCLSASYLRRQLPTR